MNTWILLIMIFANGSAESPYGHMHSIEFKTEASCLKAKNEIVQTSSLRSKEPTIKAFCFEKGF